MAKDKPFKKGPETEFTDKLFGDVADLSDEELDILYESMASGVDAGATVRELAEQVAAKYRAQNKVPPDHVLACLRATGAKTLEGAKIPVLKEIIESLTGPTEGAVEDLAFSYRNRKGMSERDKTNVDELAKELGEDWEEGGE
jgi:hypothetical protein